MADSANDLFIVKLRGVPLQISRSQIETDSPGSNFFAASLLGDFVEASNKTLSLDRHPGIFKIILDHLSGYRIFPLDKVMLKSSHGDGMSVERALRYLQDDAEYYGLARLYALVTEERERLESHEESYQEEMIDLKRYKLELEQKRLQLDLDIANRHEVEILNRERLKLLQTRIDISCRRLQAAATVAAPRQVGSLGYGMTERGELDNLTLRLRRFKGNDVLEPLPHEDNFIAHGDAEEPYEFELVLPTLPTRKRNATGYEDDILDNRDNNDTESSRIDAMFPRRNRNNNDIDL